MSALKQPTDIHKGHGGDAIAQIPPGKKRRCIPLWSVRAAAIFCADEFRAGYRPPLLAALRRMTSGGLLPRFVAMDDSPFSK